MDNFFSIITVVRNDRAAFLETLNCLKTQTCRDFKHIIIDGSENNNNLQDLITEINQDYINENDNGIYEAMNKGIDRINKNSYVIFLNAGDIFYKSKTLELVKENIEKNKNIEIIYGDVIIKDKLKIAPPVTKLNFRNGMPFSHQSVFINGNLFKFKRFDLNFKYASDFDLIYYFWKSGYNFFCLNTIISVCKPGGISDLNRISVLEEWMNILNDEKNSFYFCWRFFVENLKIFLKIKR